MSLPSWHSRQRAATHLIIIFGNGAQITVIDKCNKAETASSTEEERNEKNSQVVNALLPRI